MEAILNAPGNGRWPENARILRLHEVLERTGRSRSSVYADINAGRFVTPIKIGRRSVGWLAHEVDAWITARVVATRGEAS